jgi:hypothetical protein
LVSDNKNSRLAGKWRYVKMNEYTNYLLDRIYEVRQGYKDGEFGKEYYENTLSELVDCLSNFTVMIANKYVI